MFGNLVFGEDPSKDDCTAEQMAQVYEGAIYFLPVTSVPAPDTNQKPAMSGLVRIS